MQEIRNANITVTKRSAEKDYLQEPDEDGI